MKIRNLFVAALSLAALSASAAVDSVKMVMTRLDGSTYTETLKTEKIDADTARVRVSFGKFPRWGANAFSKIDYVDFFCDAATAAKGEDGYWVFPRGEFGTFKADKGHYKGAPVMPLLGLKKGDEAVAIIVKGLRDEFIPVVSVENGIYSVSPRFYISEIGMPPYEDIIIDFVSFKGKKANYSSMAKAYRKYQLDRGEVIPLKERIKGNPKLKYTTESIFLKFHMATFMRQMETHLNRGYHWKDVDAPNIQVVRNYDNMMQTLKKLKELGVEKADVILTNWNWRSNGRSPIYGVAEPELGGNAKCRQLTALGKDLGFQISAHILHTENYTVSPAFNKDDLALQLNGNYIHYDGMGGEAYRPCFKQVYYKQVLENYTKMQQLGFFGPLHIDVTTAIRPYPCFNLSHPCTKKDCAFYMNQIGKLSHGFFGGFTSESCYDQTANTLDFAFYVWMPPFEKVIARSPLIDRIVPMFPLVYNGIIMSNAGFRNSLAFNMRGNPDDRLQFYEWGSRLCYYGELGNDKNLPKVKEAYDEYQKVKHLQLEFMDLHKELAPNVFLTKYADGTRVVTNYSDKDFQYKKFGVVKAKDVALFK